jgi:hypothetical protein
MVLYYTPLMLGVPSLPVLTLVDSTNGFVASSASPHTSAGMNFGTADPTRKLILVAFGTAGSVASGNPSSCTIGGVTATLAASVVISQVWSHIWIADVPTGTSGSVVLSGVSGNWVSACALYAVTNLQSSTPTATSTDSVLPITLGSTTVPANGILVGTIGSNSAGSVGTASWTGSITQDFDSQFLAGKFAISGASYTALASASLSTSATYSGGGTGTGGWAAFR